MCHLLYMNNLAELQDLSYTEVNLPFLVKVWEKNQNQNQKHIFLRKIILVALLVTNSIHPGSLGYCLFNSNGERSSRIMC